MMKTTALWTLTLMVSFSFAATAGEPSKATVHSSALTLTARVEAPPQAASGPQWKSRDEYDAFNAMAGEKDADKQIALAQAFIQKFANSDFIGNAYTVEMEDYYKLGKTDQAIDAAKKVMAANPNNLDALAFLSYVFPFKYNKADADAATQLTQAQTNAQHGLELVQKLPKPANVTQEAYDQYVKSKRALFNGTLGFVGLQQNKYPDAINYLKQAKVDNPSDVYTIYRLALAYLLSTPPDDDNGIWYYAHALALAKAAKDPNVDAWEKYLNQTYLAYHGTDTGLSDIEAQAATQTDPPAGFTVSKVQPPPAKTGNNTVDAFNDLTYPLKLGGVTAQKQWDAIKGQPIENFGGTVESVEKGDDPNTYLLHIAVLPDTKSSEGYDIVLKDSTQPNVKNLAKDDSVLFKGTLDSYVATPNMILTLVGEVSSDLPDRPPAKGRPAHHGSGK